MEGSKQMSGEKMCSFCGEGRRIISVINNNTSVERKIYENENFYVTVSIGAIVEGHLLIIPKKHYLSMGELPQKLMCELKDLMDSISGILTKDYNMGVMAFEHGTGRNSDLSAASVIHAHMHLLPIPNTLLDVIEQYGCEIEQLDNISDLSQYAQRGESYLFYMDIDKKMYCIENSSLPSQFFRKVAAEKYDLGEWDWHKDYKIHNVIRTVERFSNFSERVNYNILAEA